MKKFRQNKISLRQSVAVSEYLNNFTSDNQIELTQIKYIIISELSCKSIV